MEAAITTRGRFTIPKAVREHLQLKPGDRLKFSVLSDGCVVLLPKLPVTGAGDIVKRQRRVTTKAVAAGAKTRTASRGGR